MKQGIWKSIAILLVGACTTTHPQLPGPTLPVPQPGTEPTDTGPWTFAYQSDTLQYRISRSAAIESQTDSATREVVTNNSHEVLVLSVTNDTIRYTATVDSFSTTTQGRIGTVEQVVLPVESSGILDSSHSHPDSAGPLQTCDPVQSSLQSDVRNLLIKLPAQVAPGSSWRDSTTTDACYGTVPLNAIVVRQFSVVGRTFYNGVSAVEIQRSDSIVAHGEGRQQQHRVAVNTKGTGSATYYLVLEKNSILHLTASQNLDFSIQASGRMSQFRESVKEEYSLLP